MPKSKTTTEEEKALTAVLVLSGISEKETKLYWILLNNGILSGSELIKKSGYKRGNTYALIHQLEKKGLILTIQKEGRTYFQPEPPQKVLNLLTNKLQQIQQAKNFLDEVLPQLSSRYRTSIGKPVIRYYEGEQGLKQVFEEIYNSFNKTVRGCVDPKIVKKEIWEHVLGRLMPRRVKNEVYAYSLHPEKKKEIMIKDKNNLKEIYYVDPDEYKLPCEIDVWDDKVSFISFKNNEFIGTIIENQDFATTINSLFRLCFDLLMKQKQASS